jgi:hypothetical protein
MKILDYTTSAQKALFVGAEVFVYDIFMVKDLK